MSGLVRIRLCDVPEAIRMKGLEKALEECDSFTMRVQLGIVAENPSARSYWIPEAAWEKVMFPKVRRLWAKR